MARFQARPAPRDDELRRRPRHAHGGVDLVLRAAVAVPARPAGRLHLRHRAARRRCAGARAGGDRRRAAGRRDQHRRPPARGRRRRPHPDHRLAGRRDLDRGCALPRDPQLRQRRLRCGAAAAPVARHPGGLLAAAGGRLALPRLLRAHRRVAGGAGSHRRATGRPGRVRVALGRRRARDPRGAQFPDLPLPLLAAAESRGAVTRHLARSARRRAGRRGAETRLRLLPGELRQLRRGLWLARRGDRAADLDLPQRQHLACRRRGRRRGPPCAARGAAPRPRRRYGDRPGLARLAADGPARARARPRRGGHHSGGPSGSGRIWKGGTGTHPNAAEPVRRRATPSAPPASARGLRASPPPRSPLAAARLARWRARASPRRCSRRAARTPRAARRRLGTSRGSGP